MYGMKRTTIYLPDELKARLELVASAEDRSEADVIRDALADSLDRREAPRPRVPIVEGTGKTTNWAERVGDLLDDGFGRT